KRFGNIHSSSCVRGSVHPMEVVRRLLSFHSKGMSITSTSSPSRFLTNSVRSSLPRRCMMMHRVPNSMLFKRRQKRCVHQLLTCLNPLSEKSLGSLGSSTNKLSARSPMMRDPVVVAMQKPCLLFLLNHLVSCPRRNQKSGRK